MTNDKAREALEKLPNVAAAYVNNQIEIDLASDQPLNEAVVKKALKTHKINVTSVAKK